MNIKHFVKGLSWLLVLNGLIKPLWVFGIDRKVQNMVGHETFGSYFAILNLAIILAILSDAGVTNMLNRQLALRERIGVKGLLRFKTTLSAGYVLVFCFLCWLTHVRRWDLVLLVALLQVLSSYLVFFRNILTGYQQFGADAWLSVTDKGLSLLLCAPLLYGPFAGNITLNNFLWIQAGSTFVAILIALWVARRHHEGAAEPIPFRQVLRLSAPFVLLILLMGIHTRLDAFLLERMHYHGALEAGIYAAAYRLLDAGNTAGYMTASFLVPFVARHLQEKKLIDKTVLRLRHFLMLVACCFVAFCLAFAPQLMRLLYHSNDPYASRVLIACVAVLPAYYGIHIYGSLLTADGRLAYFSKVIAGSMVANALLNVILIPEHGALACCWAALISQYAAAIALFVGAREPFGLRLQPQTLAGYALAGMLVYMAGRMALGSIPGRGFWWAFAAVSVAMIMFVILPLRKAARS